MRKLFFLAVAVVACTKAETPKADTVAAAPPPPAKLTAADVAGNWSGTSKMEKSDSVLNKWIAVHVTDSTGKLVIEGSKDSIAYTMKYDADSMIATSSPYPMPMPKKGQKGPKVTFRSVGWLKDGKLTGTSTVMLAAKPDSVVQRTRWEATKTP